MTATTRQIPNGGAGWHSPSLTSPGFGQTRRPGDAAQASADRDRDGRDSAGAWLRGAIFALAVLALAAAAVSWDAQYVLVRSVKHSTAVAGIEAAIPDIGALIFAALGIALALHGKRAIRARMLNVACVGTSLAMNALAAAPGWRELAVWVMPSAVYALASDTLIGVIRARAIARTQQRGEVLADDEATPMAIAGGIVLWLLRLAFAPPSTIGGFRRWVVEECPVAPGRRAPSAAPQAAEMPTAKITPIVRPAGAGQRRAAGRAGKQARLISLAGRRHDLDTIELRNLSRIAREIAAEVGLYPGTARRVLRAHAQALRSAHIGPQGQQSPAPDGTEISS